MSFLLGSIFGKQKREEEFHKGKALITDGIIISLVGTAFFVWSRSLSSSNSNTTPTTSNQVDLVCIHGLLALLMFLQSWADYVWHPAPRKKQDPEIWNAVGLGLGHFCWFTGQSLFLQSIYHFFSFLSLFLKDAQLSAAVSTFSTWVMTQSFLLTVLFLVLNWMEPKWQKLRREKEKSFPHWGWFQFATHTPNVVFALFDFFFLQSKTAIAANTFSFQTAIMIGIAYNAIYATFLFVAYDRSGVPIYPFIEHLKGIKLRVGFGVVLTVAIWGAFFGFQWLRLKMTS